METGAQLFTVRDYCKNTADFAETLKKIADIGYKNVQVSGTCDYEGEWLDEELRKNGLKCVLTHIPLNLLTEKTTEMCKKHDIFGCNNIGLGYFGFSSSNGTNNYMEFYNKIKIVAQTMKKNGKYFMYHNHANEFLKIDGEFILDKIIHDFEPDELGVILDTYWVQVGGGDPAAWLEKLKDRAPVIHLKDYLYNPNGNSMAVIGEGNINFDRVFEKAESAGTQYMMVEQDDCHGENPFDCLKRSYDYLCACGFN